MSVEEVGEVRYLASDRKDVIYWAIPSYSLLPQKKGFRIWSPPLVHCYASGNRGHVRWVPPGFLGLCFYSKDSKKPPVKYVRFGIADMNNYEICCCDGEWENELNISGEFRVPKFVQVEILNQHWDYFDEISQFRLFCETVNNQQYELVNSSTQTDNLCGPERLIQNLKDLYLKGKHTDVIIKIKDREFNVHKAILTARSSVFDGMFSHDLSETNSGIVPIEDCEPAVFEEFLFFVYTGRPQHLSSDNACNLYYVADKYDVPELKEEIVSFLKKSLSIETICDVICLSTKCNESELLNFAIQFFARNMKEIIVTVKWLLFLKENPVEANELTIKALEIGFTKINN